MQLKGKLNAYELNGHLNRETETRVYRNVERLNKTHCWWYGKQWNIKYGDGRATDFCVNAVNTFRMKETLPQLVTKSGPQEITDYMQNKREGKSHIEKNRNEEVIFYRLRKNV